MQEINQKLQIILKESIQHLEEVLDSLHQERLAMINADHQTLLSLIEAKTEKIDCLADLDTAMTTLLVECNEDASMTLYLEQQSSRVNQQDPLHLARLRAVWEYYVALLRACRDKNTINSQVVNLRLQRLRYEYQMITQSGDAQTASYDARGRIHTVTEADTETVI